MKKTVILLMIIGVFSKLFGFGREITLSYLYGATNISDAYLISLTIPLLIFAFIGIGVSTSYIPIYSSIEKEGNIQLADRFTNYIINVLLIVCTLLILVGLVFTDTIVKLFVSGFDQETLNLASKLTRISLFGIYFSALTYIFTSYLQLKNNFIIPALVGIPFNIILILSMVLSTKFSLNILAFGSVVAIAFQLFLLIPFAYKKGYKYILVLSKNDAYLKKMMFLSLPAIAGISVNQINVLIDRTIASRIAIGGISALDYANRLNWFVEGIIAMSTVTAIYPIISKMVAENKINELKKTLSEAIRGINFLVVPATVGSIIFADPIVRFLFGRGAFDFKAISMTSYAFVFYSVGLVGYGQRELLSRALYSLQDTKTPVINGAIAMVLNIFLNIILSKYLGIGGLALATSISALFCTILLFISLRKKIGSFGMKNIIISLIKIICASLMMGGIARLSYDILLDRISNNITLLISIGIGVVVYLAISYCMRIEDVYTSVNSLRRKLKMKGKKLLYMKRLNIEYELSDLEIISRYRVILMSKILRLIVLIIIGCIVLILVIIGVRYIINEDVIQYSLDADYVSKQNDPNMYEVLLKDSTEQNVKDKIGIVEDAYDYNKQQSLDNPEQDDITINEKREDEIEVSEFVEIIIEENIIIEEKVEENKLYQESPNDDIAQFTGDEYIDTILDQHRDEIAGEDIEFGLSIADKIDIDIIYDYLEDDLSEKEKEQLSEYLHNVLSESEYIKLKALFYKYNHLLNDE